MYILISTEIPTQTIHSKRYAIEKTKREIKKQTRNDKKSYSINGQTAPIHTNKT